MNDIALTYWKFESKLVNEYDDSQERVKQDYYQGHS